MAIRNIRTIGDPILEKNCKEVKEVTPRIKELIEDMFDTMYEANGVGLAAPQVGILKRIVVIDTTGEDPIVMINPRIVEIEGTELLARAICHETDHLDGHLYVEKVEGDLMSTDDYYADLEDAEWEEE